MKPFEDLNSLARHRQYGQEAAFRFLDAVLQNLSVPDCAGIQILTLGEQNLTDDDHGNFTIVINTLENPFVLGTLMIRDHQGTLELSADAGENWAAIGVATLGDMLKSMYDPSNHGYVDQAAALKDGAGTLDPDGIRALIPSSSGDMLKSTYDPSDNGYVDEAAALKDGAGTLDADAIRALIPQTTQYALSGDGSGIAAATFANTSHHTLGKITLAGAIIFRQLDTAESFYKRIDTGDDDLIFDFGKTADNELYLTIGVNSYTSAEVFSENNQYLPLEVGVLIDKTNAQLAFFYGGRVEAWQVATFTFPTLTGYEQHDLGANFDGVMNWLGLTGALAFDEETKHTPLQKGMDQLFEPLLYYDMQEGAGATLTDRVGQKIRQTGFDLTISSGDWRQWSDAMVEAPEAPPPPP